MTRTLDSQGKLKVQYQSKNPTPANNTKRIWIAIGAAVIVAIALFFSVNAWLSHQMNQTEFTTGTQQLEIVIGNDVVRVPANYIRFEYQRASATADQLDLVYLFPEMVAYSESKKSQFNATGNDSRLIHISLRKRKLSLDMSNRLQPIYAQLFEGQATQGPDNLTLQPLRAGSGYDGEILAIGQMNQKNWVARCQTPQSNMRPVCIRDVFIGRELSALYSFPLHMLKDWRQIDLATEKFLKDVVYE